MGKIDVTLVKSTIGRPGKHHKVVRSLGLRKLNQTVRHEDNPCIRGMVDKVSHLLRVETVEEE
ncbi:MAG: 50S ribosomal protein L30 [bacterium]|nr:50S ribosomal protein L30 [bacterium]MDT8364952.1 50S ribosomal protein L30 [bacterium]